MTDEQRQRGRDPQDRTEAQDRPVPHETYGTMDPKKAKKEAPGIEEHDAAGQGLSG